MAYKYCEQCHAGNDAPTTREALADDYNCKACGSPLPLWDDEVKEGLVDLLNRIEKLEKNDHPRGIWYENI